MRRVLFIAYLFPPIANSGTRRSLSFANRLPDEGWQPVVLTADPREGKSIDLSLLHEVREGTRIERVALESQTRAERWSAWLPQPWRERAVAGLSWRLQARHQVPDAVAGWLAPAVARGVALHQELGFDAIYASGWPWTGFLVAQQVAALTGLPYVLDYRDNWSPIGSQGANEWDRPSAEQAAGNPKLEREAALQASALITVTQTLVTAMHEATGRQDLHLITNGFEPDDFLGVPGAPADGKLRVTYTGVWRPGYGLQDLYAALNLLRQWQDPVLARLEVTVAGFAPGAAVQHGVQDLVQELGPVSHAQALTLMRQADVQFLPVPTGFYGDASLPGKLFEYFGSGQPILASVPASSEVARVLADVGGGLCVPPGNPEAIARVLQSLAGVSRLSALGEPSAWPATPAPAPRRNWPRCSPRCLRLRPNASPWSACGDPRRAACALVFIR
jgi:glycosyltransferase involved in cell wall biosynthesis